MLCKGGLLPPPPPSTTSGKELLKGSLGGMWAEGRSYIQTQHSQLRVFLTVLSTVNLHFQGWLVPISLRPVLRIVAAHVRLPSGLLPPAGSTKQPSLSCSSNIKDHGSSFPGGPVVKSPPCNAWDTGSIPDLGGSHVLCSN